MADNFTDASKTGLYLIPETTPGTTPSTPAWVPVRFTSEDLQLTRQRIASDEITENRDVKGLYDSKHGAGGSVNFEVSYAGDDGWLGLVLTSLMANAWDTGVLINGTTLKTLSFEKKFRNDSGTINYHRLVGAVVDSFSLRASVGGLVTGSFGVLGMGGELDTAIISGATYGTPLTASVANAATLFTLTTSSGYVGNTEANLMEISLDVKANARERGILGSTALAGIGLGQFEVTGMVRAYFRSNALFAEYLANTENALAFTLGTASGATEGTYLFDLPRIAWDGNAKVVAGGRNQDVMAELPFRALQYYDDPDYYTMKVTATDGS